MFIIPTGRVASEIDASERSSTARILHKDLNSPKWRSHLSELLQIYLMADFTDEAIAKGEVICLAETELA